MSGVRPCHVLDHVEVDAGAGRVTITLFEGSAPSDEPVACIELAKTKRTRVQLDRPLGDRELVDGADPSPGDTQAGGPPRGRSPAASRAHSS